MSAQTTLAPPSPEEIILARRSQDVLKRCLQVAGKPRQLRLLGDSEQVLEVPEQAFRLLLEVLEQMSRGNAVTLIPVHADLTTQEAADLLNVSRPFLIGLLKKGALPFHKVGTHRRVKFRDLLAYKERVDQAQEAAMQELAAQAQELDMGY